MNRSGAGVLGARPLRGTIVSAKGLGLLGAPEAETTNNSREVR